MIATGVKIVALSLYLRCSSISISSSCMQKNPKSELFLYAGRIDRKIEFPLPDEKTKKRIFQIHTSRMTLADDVTLDELIMAKDDLSGADIKVCMSALVTVQNTNPICTASGTLCVEIFLFQFPAVTSLRVVWMALKYLL